MKKLFSFFVVALLLGLTTNVFALVCSTSVEPNAGGASQCIESVYNNSGSTLDSGDVVIWDLDSSTGDDDNWVTTTTTADTYLVAGVVVNAINAGESGTIVVRGFANVDVQSGLNTVKGPACSSSVAGSARSCVTDAANFGFVTTVAASGSANVCVHCNK